jgi:hypothetical protein
MSEEDAMHVVFGAVLSKIHLSSELSQIESWSQY